MSPTFILEKQKEAQDRGHLNIWTVYDHPTDFPNSYVARRFEVRAGGSFVTGDIVQSDALSIIRKSFRQCGMACLTRAESDDPKILECWL